MGLLTKIFGNYSEKEIKRIIPIKDKVLELESKYSPMTDSELKAQTPALKERLENGYILPKQAEPIYGIYDIYSFSQATADPEKWLRQNLLKGQIEAKPEQAKNELLDSLKDGLLADFLAFLRDHLGIAQREFA